MIHYANSSYRYFTEAICKTADSKDKVTTKDYRVTCNKCIEILRGKYGNIWNRSARLADLALPVQLAGTSTISKGTI